MAVCIACFSIGQCNGTCNTSGIPSSDERRVPGAYVAAMAQRGIENYPALACGHFTTREAQAVYRHSRPKGKDYFCETCGKWVKKRPKSKVTPLPDQPEF